MRGKRSKQYRKLMQQFSIHFGFREPYQVLVDADFVKDTTRCKMDLLAALERTFHGKVKPLITQCSIRHLYAYNTDPTVAAAIDVAKTVCERRRCGHHPDSHPEPLSTLECISSILDPAKNGTNKHRYCVASQDVNVRRAMRSVRGVPLVYVSRSVMILEPMTEETRRACESGEKGKLRDGFVRNIRGQGGEKRKRENDDEGSGSQSEGGGNDGDGRSRQEPEPEKKKKKKAYGPKGPNPLSVQKSKKTKAQKGGQASAQQQNKQSAKPERQAATAERDDGVTDTTPKRKRRRRHKPAGIGTDGVGGGNEASVQAGVVTQTVQGEAVDA